MTEKQNQGNLTEEIEAQLNSLFEAASLDIEAVLIEDAENIEYDLRGKDSEMLLTDGASLLYAFNHLLNQIYFRRLGRGRNIVFDCMNYRSDRELELKLMADVAAEQARTTRRKLVLQPMNAAERRIIHMRLAEKEGIRTESEGFGQNRRISILPV
jgi:spoIIIJ-associated protein